MLLKDNLNRLFKLGLGRANFVLAKKILRNSESITTNKLRVNFLRRCSTLNVFPKTIESIKVNYSNGIKSLEARSKLRTNRFVLNESIRALRRLIAIKTTLTGTTRRRNNIEPTTTNSRQSPFPPISRVQHHTQTTQRKIPKTTRRTSKC